MALTEQDILDSGRAGGVAIRGGALRTASYFGAMLLSLASVPFMTRQLGEVDYGYFVTASSIVFIVGGATEAGLTNLGIREYAVLASQDRERFLRNLVGLRLTLTVAGVAAAILLTAATGAGGVIVKGTLIMGVGLLLALTQQTYAVSLATQLRLGWVASLELLKHATISASTIVLVALGATLLPFFFTSVLGGVAVLVCTLLLLRRDATLVPSFDLAEWRRVLRDVLPYALAAGVSLIYFRFAIVLMHYIADDRETGLYAAAFRIVETVGVVPWLMVSSGFPILARAARDDEERLRYALQKLFEVSVLAGALIALSVAILAPLAIDVIAGDDFKGSVPVLRLQALSLVTAFLVATWSYALLSLREFRSLLLSFTTAALVALGLSISLIPPLGAEGAALATFGAEAVLALACLLALVRASSSLRPSFSFLLRLAPAVAAAAAVGALLPLAPVLVSAIATGVYVSLAFTFRAVAPELVNALLRREPGGDG